MKLKNLYQEIVKKGIDSDVRNFKEIEIILKENKKNFEELSNRDKELFDQDVLFNPFADTRILTGDLTKNIKSMIVGIDVDGGELVLVDRLREKGEKIDLVVSHHPQGRAYAKFYDVMDLQVDVFANEGIALGVCERSVDIAKLLNIDFMCAHTPCDNLAYQYLRKKIDKVKPTSLGNISDILQNIPEYIDAAKNNNPPQIVLGNKKSRCRNIHLEFTGGTEGPKGIYKELAAKGVDTIIAMHQSEEHFNKCKESKINVIFASHIASDSLGINIMLDYIESKEKIKIYEFSGFRRFKRNK